MQMMIANPKETRILGINARRLYVDLFQQEVIWASYEKFYNEIIATQKVMR